MKFIRATLGHELKDSAGAATIFGCESIRHNAVFPDGFGWKKLTWSVEGWIRVVVLVEQKLRRICPLPINCKSKTETRAPCDFRTTRNKVAAEKGNGSCTQPDEIIRAAR